MSPYWRRIAVVGPTQCGKTTISTNIPLLYFLFEKKEDVIFGIPTMDMAAGMWNEKLKPVIEDSRYADMLPTQGAGSKGGAFTAVQFKNGTTLRFMAAGGGAENKSSFTAPNILLTEVDKMDEARGDASETDPVSLIQMRADAFEESKIIMECTVTNEDGRIWQEAMVMGTGSEIYVACPFCHAWQTLERSGLVFDATSQVSAEETARYKCEHCDALWTNGDRLEALQDPRLVHRGQSINEFGEVIGEMPPTKIFGLRYNVLHSPMQSLAKTAGQQWEADTSELKEKKKAMIQSKWVLPYRDDDVDRSRLTMSHLKKLSSACRYSLGTVPDWADEITFATDIQKGYCYYMAEAYCLKSMRSIPIEYGTVEQREDSDVGFFNMLNEVNNIAIEGWKTEVGSVKSASAKMVDCGYRYDLIQQWLAKNRGWFGVKGIARSEKVRITGKKEIYKIDGILSVRHQDNGQNLWFIEVDNTKSFVHDRYMLESEALDGYRYVPNNVDIVFFKHMTAEHRVYDPLGESFTWEKSSRRNDYLDVASYNVALAYFLKQKGRRQDERQQKIVEENHRKNGLPLPPKQQVQHGRTYSSRRGNDEGNTWVARGRSRD